MNTRKSILGVAGALVVLLGAQVAAVAAVTDRANHPRPSADAQPRISGTATIGCRVGFDTETSTNTPPDDSTADNTPAATVTLTKSCAGAVIGAFVTEASTPNSGDFIHIDMRATCVGPAGQNNPCTTGQQVFASPGHTFMQNGPQTGFGTRSVTMMWTGLPRGKWTFEVLPGGNGTANMQFRSFEVFALNGG